MYDHHVAAVSYNIPRNQGLYCSTAQPFLPSDMPKSYKMRAKLVSSLWFRIFHMTSQGCAVELWLAQWSASLEVHSTRPSRGRNFSVVPTRYAPVHLAVNEYTGQKYSVEGKVVKEFLATALIQLLPLKSEGTDALVLRRAPSPWSMPFMWLRSSHFY